MIITCQSCGSRFQIRDELLAGGPKRTKCKKCGEILVIKPPERAEASGGVAQTSSGAAVKETVKAAAGSADVKSRDSADTAPQAAVEGKKPVEATGKPAPAAVPEGTGSGEAPAAAPAEDAEDIQAKLEKRRLQMEDEISGRLNKAALETLDFDVLGELANKIKSIEDNSDFQPETNTQLFACISCLAIYSLFTDDPRQCANCAGDLALVRGDDILKQFGMFNR